MPDPRPTTRRKLIDVALPLENEGFAPVGALLRDTLRRPNAAIDADQIKERAPLLFRVAEDRKGAKGASNFKQPGDQLARGSRCLPRPR